jgi:exonuclease III
MFNHQDIDILCLTETWLEQEFKFFNNYNITFQSKPKHKGGVLLSFKRSLKPMLHKTVDENVLICSLLMNENRLHVIAAYVPPNDDERAFIVLRYIESHISRLKQFFPLDGLILLGDWNMVGIKKMNIMALHQTWNRMVHDGHPQGPIQY